MQFGVSLSAIAQQPAGVDMQQAFADICTYVGAARDLGFDMVYQGQHYLTDPYQQLQTMPLLARISAEARGMGLVATMLVPLHHPVDLAERVATMDVITGGRFTLSAALGYRDEEYDNFGVPRRTRVGRYLECLEAMRLLWTGEKVNYDGQYFQLRDAQLMLRPVQQPHPPVWVAANSDAAITRAGRLGYTWYVNPHAKFDTISQQVEMYLAADGQPIRAHRSGCPSAARCSWGARTKRHSPAPRHTWAASTKPTPNGVRTRRCRVTKTSGNPSRTWHETGLSSAVTTRWLKSCPATASWACRTAASALCGPVCRWKTGLPTWSCSRTGSPRTCGRTEPRNDDLLTYPGIRVWVVGAVDLMLSQSYCMGTMRTGPQMADWSA